MICPGCGVETTGRYCANCGQRLEARVLSLGALLRDVLEDQFSLNSALPRTLHALFFKPGFLTTEYLRLRLSPYIPPFRLYLVASVLCFLALGLLGQPRELNPSEMAARDSVFEVVRDSISAHRARGDSAQFVFGFRVDPTQEDWAHSVEVHLGNERLNRAVKTRIQQMSDLPPEEALRRLLRNTLEKAPTVMFLLLPLHALILKLLYLRSRRYYVTHFIFSLHVHAFSFAVFLLMLLLQAIPAAVAILFLWLLIYPWFAMKRVYEQGIILTTLKWSVLGFSYMTAVTFGLLITITVAVFTL